MSDDFYRTHRSAGADRSMSDTMSRLRAYLAGRSSETWLFFFAGIVVGAILG
ncbi:hypothetical protein [Azospirillum halopraeferens]|uniref:hypothetical protein n=1 Tax=Azospirillum halopraeferens TaxID=34010 RepID=UPI00041E6AD3|nr:hypothetical protein [Azospirillum halopraeferens]